ncbi:MAG: hypothetical protein KBT04_03740 [Bacteroidales bacterium]|nr:hypothetical protein [Candidatus Colimorpha onthohippi]
MALIITANIIRLNSIVRGVDVRIDYNESDTLVSTQRIQEQLLDRMPILTSLKVKDIDNHAVSESVMLSPYIEHCHTYVSIGGTIVVKARQRRPILHLYYDKNECYIDQNGQCVPLSTEGYAEVMVANGHFRQKIKQLPSTLSVAEWANDTIKSQYDITRLWTLAHFIDQEEGYRDMFDQIYIETNGDLILIPKLGTHTINIGDPENLTEKFRQLIALYKQALPIVGWNTYKTINLKFKGQAVCRK